MKKNYLIIMLLAFLPLWLTAQDTITTAGEVIKKVVYPAGFTEQLNVVYKNVNGWEGKMDLYLPPKQDTPTPIVINIHGGGWNKGTKEGQSGFSSFFKNGYAVANIEYRLSQQATAPAAVEDSRCALLYIINHAKELNIDVNKIVVMGSSAGGHLALMTGLLGNNNTFDNDCGKAKKVKVAAIIDKYGITDVQQWPSKSAPMWLGSKVNDVDFVQSVSPIYQVTKNSPPVFIVHGDADPIVSYQQSVDLKNKLDKMNIKNVFITIPGGLHGKFDKDQNSMINTEVMNFLKSLGIHN